MRATPLLVCKRHRPGAGAEYGFPGPKDLVKEVEKRLGRGLEWAVSEARHIIHDNDIDGLRQLLTEYPALLLWKTDENNGGPLGIATGSFGDSGDAFREEHFTPKVFAELLDASAVVASSACDGLIHSRARDLIDLFYRGGLLPRTLKFLAALGDVDDLVAVNEAFTYACHFEYAPVAALLLDRSITVDAALCRRIDGGQAIELPSGLREQTAKMEECQRIRLHYQDQRRELAIR